MPCDGPLCVTCPQQLVGQRRILPDGQGTNGILIVGESPWRDEVRLGRPFAGAAGAQLDKWFRRLGVSRDAFTITNSLWCAPPYLGWFNTREAADAINHCRPYLDDLIERVKPKVIVTLGGTALQRVCGVTGLESRHSYLHDSPYNIPVIPTYHPSFIMQGNHKLTPAVLFALRKAFDVAAGKLVRESVRYLLDPLMGEFEDYMREWRGEPLAFDIETPYSAKLVEDETEEDVSFTIIRASLSWKSRTAVSFPWTEPYVSFALSLLERADETIFWNHSFDVPRLRAAGAKFRGRIMDAMWAWHFLHSDLPKGLGFVAPFYSDLSPWKELNDSEPAFYSAVDADATIRCFEGVRRHLQEQGRWDAFLRHCVEVSPLLTRMGQQGLLVDRGRQDSFKLRLEEELAIAKAELQGKVPDSLKPLHPKEGYKRTPKDTSGMVEVEFGEAGERRWAKRLPFNPDSPKQVADLIKHLGLPMPKNRKTGRESTGAKYLERFAKKHDTFRWILECRQRADMLGTFIWPVNEMGRVTTLYGFHPSTWRKSSRSVNLQNIPKRNDLAKEFRRMLVASPGHLLIEADSAAIEAVLVGYCASDPDYIRLAKLGVHDFLASHIVKEPASVGWSDDELRLFLQSIKKRFKEERESAKRCIHGSNYMLSAHGMHDEYAEFFPTTGDAERMQDFYFQLFPRIKAWHRSTLERAAKETFLDNHFRYRHWFWDVFAWNRNLGEWGLGQDAKRAIAFVPQSDASAIQTEFLLDLAKDERVAPHLRLIIHDSIVLEVPEREVEIVAALVHQTMTKPLAELGGLSIGAEVSVGPSLGEMETLPLAEGENKVTKTLDIPPLCDSLQINEGGMRDGTAAPQLA